MDLSSFIHLVARELATRIYVAKSVHQCSIFPRSNAACNPFQPSVEGDRGPSSHYNSVHDNRVQRNIGATPGGLRDREQSLPSSRVHIL